MQPIQPITGSKTAINAWLIEDHHLPLISVSFVFARAGSASDPADKSGQAALLADILLEGAGNYDSLAFQQEMEQHAIKIHFSANRDTFSGTIQTLTANFDKAVELTRLALTEPALEASSLKRLQSQQAAYLDYIEQTPNPKADKVFWAQVFKGHPYANITSGTRNGIKAITPKSLKRFLYDGFTQDVLTIGIVGDVTPDQASTLIDQVFGSLPRVSKLDAIPAYKFPEKCTVTTVEQPGGQSIAIFAQPGLTRDDPRYYAGVLLNYILGGGGFASRLMEEVREKRGLTYGIGTNLATLTGAPLLIGQVSTKNETVLQALDLTRQVWKDLAVNGVTAAELQAAKDHENGSFALQFDSTSSLSDMLALMQYYRLSIHYLTERTALINAVSLQDINNLARSMLNVDQLQTLVLGQPTQ